MFLLMFLHVYTFFLSDKLCKQDQLHIRAQEPEIHHLHILIGQSIAKELAHINQA